MDIKKPAIIKNTQEGKEGSEVVDKQFVKSEFIAKAIEFSI